MSKKYLTAAILLIGLCCLLSVAIYYIPPIHERLSWRVDNLRVAIKRYFNPPEDVVFVPQEKVDEIISGTLTALAPTLTATPQDNATLTSLPPPSITPTAIPQSVSLTGIRHEYQKFNNCAPSNLSMVLSYWGWQGDQFDTRAYLRPSFEIDDKNVNPFEIVNYVEQYSEFAAVWRVGGDLGMLKRLVAAGFPVLIEKGLDEDAWLGHYQTVSGYNDSRNSFLVYDSYQGPPEAYAVPYDTVAQFWRHFNFVYIVIYPRERAEEVSSILGPQVAAVQNYRYAADLALKEVGSLTGRELYFAWFNVGSNLVYLQDYAGAAQAYDNAFAVYATLSAAERPWRMLWYQDGPYAAYYHTGRYQDVVNLANTTLINVDKPVLEETYYWKGMAEEALGDRTRALEDLQRAVQLNPNSTPAGEEYNRLNSN